MPTRGNIRLYSKLICQGGHYQIAELRNSQNKCKLCAVIKQKKRSLSNPKNLLENRKRARDSYHAVKNDPLHKWKVYVYHLKQKFRLTEKGYLEMLFNSRGRCYNIHCRKLDERICVDHDHSNGFVRGLLCQECNKALGTLQDSPEKLLGLIGYLKAA